MMREGGQGARQTQGQQQRPKLSANEINAIKQRVDLVALIGPHVQKLQQRGKEYVGLCPFHKEATGSFHIIPEKGFFHCFGCGAHGDAFEWLAQTEKLSFGQALAKLQGQDVPARSNFVPVDPKVRVKEETAERKRKVQKAQQIWDEAQLNILGTPVETYLLARRVLGYPPPPTIRFHPRLWNVEAEQFMPAMVACICGTGGRIVGVHRTYLRSDGRAKARVDIAKMMLGDCQGRHVRLDNYGPKLIVAEGIETALAVKKACPALPVWAALSLNNMDAPVPASVKELILCADGDNKDPKAADKVLQKAALAHQSKGHTVRIATPTHGQDFNDMIMGRAA